MKIPACLAHHVPKTLERLEPLLGNFEFSLYSQKKSPKKKSRNDETFEVIDITKYTCSIQVQRRMDLKILFLLLEII